MKRFAIILDVDNAEKTAEDVLDRLLDEGVIQDVIQNDEGDGEGPLHIASVYCQEIRPTDTLAAFAPKVEKKQREVRIVLRNGPASIGMGPSFQSVLRDKHRHCLYVSDLRPSADEARDAAASHAAKNNWRVVE